MSIEVRHWYHQGTYILIVCTDLHIHKRSVHLRESFVSTYLRNGWIVTISGLMIVVAWERVCVLFLFLFCFVLFCFFGSCANFFFFFLEDFPYKKCWYKI